MEPKSNCIYISYRYMYLKEVSHGILSDLAAKEITSKLKETLKDLVVYIIKMETRQRDLNKSLRNKDGLVWRRLTRITNDTNCFVFLRVD